MNVATYPDVLTGSSARPAVTLGNFDGVHLGHQRILATLKERAAALGGPTVVLTFEPHPISVLRPDQAPRRISTGAQKQELLAACGIDALVVIPFTQTFSRLTAEDFVREVLVERLRAAEIVLGGNFRFGRGRAGDLAMLRGLGEANGFAVREVEPELYGESLISSSRIREALAEGRVKDAAAMLGRPYFLDGTVVRGDGRGATIGFPTANVEWKGDLLLADGVYVTSARVGDASLCASMSHVGRRPTFGVDARAVEAHLFDFAEEIYGRALRLLFHERLRGTVTFSGPQALREQLERDREQAKAFFRGGEGGVVL